MYQVLYGVCFVAWCGVCGSVYVPASIPLGVPVLLFFTILLCLSCLWAQLEGLRTLLTAKTERTEEQYSEWLKGFQEAETSMEGREEKVLR